MAQFDVFRNANSKSNKIVPYLLDVQTDLLDMLATRVVVPLIVADKLKAAPRLNPEFRIGRQKLVMSTAELAGIPVRAFGEKVTSLKDRRTEIIAALDLLLTGA